MVYKLPVLIVLFSIITSVTASAQAISAYADSLTQLISTLDDSVEKVQVLSNLSYEYIYWEKYEQGRNYAYQAVTLAQKINAPSSYLEESLLLLASTFYKKSETDSLNLLLDSILMLCTNSNNLYCLIEYYNTKASIYDISVHPDSSLFFYQKALELTNGDPYWEDLILSNIGVTFSGLKLQDRARYYYQQALEIAKSDDDIYMEALIFLNIAYSYIQEDQLDSTDYYLSNAFVKAKASAYKDIEASVHCYMGLSNLKRGQLDIADSFLNLSLNTYQALGLELDKGETLTYLAQLYFTKREYEKTEKFALEALEVNTKSGSKIDLLTTYKILAGLHRVKNNFELADQYMLSYQSLQDSLQQRTLENQFSSLEMEYQLGQKEAALKLLNTQRESERRTQQLVLLASLILLFSLSFIIYLLLKQSKRRRLQNQWLETQVKKRTTELNKSNEELKNYVEEMRTFTHITSHDLKEPLRNISSFTSLLERRLASDLSASNAEFMNQIKSNAQQMRRLIDGIHHYSTIDLKGHLFTLLEVVNLPQLLVGIEKILATTIQESNAIIHYDNELPSIQSSPEALQVITKNLIENGIKYNRSQQPTIHISYQSTSKEHHLIIQDNGIGIEPEYRQQVFEMFKRLHNQEEFKGTGMGLAICRKLVRRLGGDLFLESEIGKGSSFKITLPIHAKLSTVSQSTNQPLDTLD
ncbi:MAG: ATP-binding protein [Bacteroidota bacterium]